MAESNVHGKVEGLPGTVGNGHGLPDTDFLNAMAARHQILEILSGFVKSMVMNAVCRLDIPDILAKAGPGAFLSVEEVAKQLPGETVNSEFLSHVLKGGAQFGILNMIIETSVDGRVSKRYGLNKVSMFLVRENNPGSMAPGVLMQMHKVAQAPWLLFHTAVLTGQYPFTLAHGKNLWQMTKEDSTWNEDLNKAMDSFTILVVDTIVNKYDGFEGVKTLVDVGGGSGRFLKEVVAKHPGIHGINFDLPHVVAQAHQIKGVQNVGGDMFESIPEGDTMFMKKILHDWDDQRCVQILKNCIKALPAQGKLVISEVVVPEDDEENPFKAMAVTLDLTMLAHTDGGIERTKEQWEALLQNAGFARWSFVQLGVGFDQGVIEAYKN